MTRIFAAEIGHETHGFNRFPTTINHFRQCLYLEGDVIRQLANSGSTWSGLFDVADAAGWTVVHPLAAFATPGGKVEQTAFETLWQKIEPALRDQGPFDGIFWQMHGGMLAEHLDDPEGEIIRRTRDIVGHDIPVAVTLDLHSNISPAMVQMTDIMCSFQTTPHVDMHETGYRAASLLRRALVGEITPVTHSIHLPILEAIDHGRTLLPDSPIPVMLRQAKEIMAADPALLDVSFLSGFPFCDASDTGTSALIVTDGDHPRFRAILDQFGDYIWQTRDDLSITVCDMDEGIKRAMVGDAAKGPCLLADFTDTSDGGGYGDSPNLLKKLLAHDAQGVALGALWDSEAVALAHQAGAGATITLDLGGRCDPEFAPPLPVTAQVQVLSDTGEFHYKGPFAHGLPGKMGRSACLQIGGVQVIVTDHAYGIHDREEFRIFGITPEEKNIVSIKGYNHFRADFDATSRGLIYVDSGGIFTLNFKRFSYYKVRRPMWHLDTFERLEGITRYAHTEKGRYE